jgi:hypothetical protein
MASPMALFALLRRRFQVLLNGHSSLGMAFALSLEQPVQPGKNKSLRLRPPTA